MDDVKNLCAPVPTELHAKIRQRQEESGLTLSQYMTQLITNYYEMEGRSAMKENQRTVAFQVPQELFEQFKEYLKKHGIKQNAFFNDCIRRALEEDEAQNQD